MQRAPRGTEVGHAEAVDVVNALQNRDGGPEDNEMINVRIVTSMSDEWRRRKLMEKVKLPEMPRSFYWIFWLIIMKHLLWKKESVERQSF